MQCIGGLRQLLLLAVALMITTSIACPCGAESGADPGAIESRLELIGQVGGSITAVTLSDTLAYAGIGGEFQVFDVADPTDIAVLGRLRVSHQPIHNILLDDHYAYLTVETQGLVIVDVSDPSAPRIASQSVVAGSDIGDIAIQGRMLYAVSDGFLHVVDITNPGDPIEVASCAMSGMGSLSALAVSGGYAYVARPGHGIIVIDVSDPASLLEVGDFTQWSDAREIARQGQYVYVATDSGWLRVIDFSDLARPYETGHASTGKDPRRLIVNGNYAFEVTIGAFLVIDVGNPTAPTTIEVYLGEPPRIQDVSVENDRALVVDIQGLRVFRVPDPAVSDPLGDKRTAGYARNSSAPAPNLASGISSFETTRKNGEQLTPTPEQLGLYTIMTAPVDLAVGDDVYVAAGISGARVVDVTDPAAPEEVSHVDVPGTVRRIDVQGDYVYAASGQLGLQVIDAANSLSPVQVGSVPAGAGTYTYNADIEGITAFVMDASGLRTFDVSDPTTPAPLDFVKIYAACDDLLFRDLVVDDGFVYMIENSEHWRLGRCRYLAIGRFTGPSEFSWIGSYGTQSWVRAVSVLGDLAVIACEDALEIVGLADKAVTVREAVYPLDDVRGVTLAGNYVFAASAEGVTVLDVSDPTTPFGVAFYATPAPAEKVAVVGDIVYVADGPGGLLILRFDEPALFDSTWLPMVSTP